MNGARSLLHTLVDSGVEVCFANPGTSEMHFVAALAEVPQMRAVLGLYEGVVTGAADGYARMTGRPAAALLHLGPGLANGMANLHNARRAATPLLTVVGDHALPHKPLDAPLESDIDAAAGTVSGWVRRSMAPDAVARDAVEAVAAATSPPGCVATLILPADVAWSDVDSPGTAAPADPSQLQPDSVPSRQICRPAAAVPEERIAAVAKILAPGEPVTFLLGGAACRERALLAASRIARATGARVLVETFPARLERGAGLPDFPRLEYLAEMATDQLAGTRHLVLAGARSPVSFFAYPGRPSDLVPEGAEVHGLADGSEDVTAALEALADEVAAGVEPEVMDPATGRELPSGELTVTSWAEVIGALLPENAIVSDESVTSRIGLAEATARSPRHDWLTLTGGAIGQGLPVAVGAAVACPDRPVIALEADGSAMYTIQSLWTMAREQLDVTVVLLNNRAYAILRMELQRVGAVRESPGKEYDAGAGGDAGSLPATDTLLDLSHPDLDFVALATGMGVPASRARTAEELAEQFSRAVAEPGPHLIEALVPPVVP